jgi:hypothetical protein
MNLVWTDLELWLDVRHGLTVASGTPQHGHPAGIFSAELRCADGHINEGFIDQQQLLKNSTFHRI